MKDYGKVRSASQPNEVEITPTMVFVASDITPYEEELEGAISSGYEYNYKQYTKDEYITLLTETNAQAIAELQQELAAAKILLGVE